MTKKWQDRADLLLKLLSIIAIVAAGVWAYVQFDITRTAEANVQVNLSTEYHKYSEDARLLLVHIKPKNIGKVVVSPGKKGFVVSIKSIPKNLKMGAVDLEKLPEIYKVDLTKRFPDGYDLEPGVEYDEIVALIVPKNSLYAVKAIFDLDDDEVDQSTVARVD